MGEGIQKEFIQLRGNQLRGANTMKRDGYESYRSNEQVWLKYSRQTVRRSVYKKDGRFFIVWGGEMIEVKRITNCYVTIGEY